MELHKLNKGAKALISSIDETDSLVAAKLREIGFAEGDEVEIIGFGPFGQTPICVRLNETLIALRPREASRIFVERKII